MKVRIFHEDPAGSNQFRDLFDEQLIHLFVDGDHDNLDIADQIDKGVRKGHFQVVAVIEHDIASVGIHHELSNRIKPEDEDARHIGSGDGWDEAVANLGVDLAGDFGGYPLV